jgi:hypothetical protein
VPDKSQVPQNNTPRLGELAPERKCSRTVNGIVGPGEVLCGRPAVHHIDWGPHAGYVCEEHREEALTRWTPRAHHAVGPACGMPGSVWFDATWEGEEQSWCSIPDLPTAEPVRAVAEAVA